MRLWLVPMVALALIAASCSSSGDDDTVDDAPSSTAAAGVENAEIDAGLEAALDAANTELADSNARIAELEEELAMVVAALEDAEALSADGAERVVALEAELSELRLAFEADLVAARQTLVDRLPSVACELGTADADAGRVTGAPDRSRLIEASATEAAERDQFDVVIDGVLDVEADTVATRYDECYEARRTAIDGERLAAERESVSALLPVVCSFERDRGFYVDADGEAVRASSLDDYVSITFLGSAALPVGWERLDAVAEESARCQELPATAFGSGTYLVGDDIEASTYRSVEPVADTCYWERTTANGDIRDNQFTQSAAQIVINVSASDYSVQNDGCGVMALELRTALGS